MTSFSGRTLQDGFLELCPLAGQLPHITLLAVTPRRRTTGAPDGRHLLSNLHCGIWKVPEKLRMRPAAAILRLACGLQEVSRRQRRIEAIQQSPVMQQGSGDSVLGISGNFPLVASQVGRFAKHRLERDGHPAQDFTDAATNVTPCGM